MRVKISLCIASQRSVFREASSVEQSRSCTEPACYCMCCLCVGTSVEYSRSCTKPACWCVWVFPALTIGHACVPSEEQNRLLHPRVKPPTFYHSPRHCTTKLMPTS